MTLPYAEITPIPATGPDATPTLFNDRYSEIDENFEFLHDTLYDAIADIEALDTRLIAVEVEVGSQVASAVQTDWHYRAAKTHAELWAPNWTLLNPTNVTAPAGAALGAITIDVNSSAELVLGCEYIIAGGGNQQVITVSQILGPTEIQILAALSYLFPAASTIKKTNFTVDQLLCNAKAYDGDVYYCGPMPMGASALKSCVIMRNEDSASDLALYFKDAAHSTWTEALWSLRRTMPDGSIEIEHLLPVDDSDDVLVKIVCAAVAPTDYAEITGIVFLSEYSGLGGTPRTGDIMTEIEAAAKVQLTDMADIVTASFIGKNSSGTGSPERLSVETVKAMLSLGSYAYRSTLEAQAAESVLANPTLSSNTPSAVALAEQTLLGRITGSHVMGLSVPQIIALIVSGLVHGSGYTQLLDGTIIQWVGGNASTSGAVITYPVTFPTAVLAYVPGVSANAASYKLSAVPASVGDRSQIKVWSDTGTPSFFLIVIGN